MNLWKPVDGWNYTEGYRLAEGTLAQNIPKRTLQQNRGPGRALDSGMGCEND